MSWILYIILGGFAGWLVGRIFRGKSFGFLMNIIVGIVGGLFGGWLFNKLGINIGDGFWGSLVTAVFGGGILVLIAGLVKKKEK